VAISKLVLTGMTSSAILTDEEKRKRFRKSLQRKEALSAVYNLDSIESNFLQVLYKCKNTNINKIKNGRKQVDDCQILMKFQPFNH